MMKEMVLSEVTLLLGSYPDPANSTSKYSDSVLGGNCLLGYALVVWLDLNVQQSAPTTTTSSPALTFDIIKLITTAGSAAVCNVL